MDEACVDLERGIPMIQSKQNQNSNLFDPSPSSISAPALVVTVSGKQIDHVGKNPYVHEALPQGACPTSTSKGQTAIVQELIELNQPQDELRSTVAQIKNDVHKIAKDVRKGANNGTNSLTVAVLFATISLATIFTIPSAENDDWVAVVVNRPSFQIFLVSNAFALYASLTVVLVQTTLLITGESETKTKRQVIHVSNMLLWLASVFTSVAFMVLAYIVVGRKHEWVAVLITVVGGVTTAGVLGTLMCYMVIARMEEISVIAREKTAKMGTNTVIMGK